MISLVQRRLDGRGLWLLAHQLFASAQHSLDALARIHAQGSIFTTKGAQTKVTVNDTGALEF